MKEDLLKINWKDECKSKNTEETADMLLEYLYKTEKRNVPTVTTKNHIKSVPVDKELSQLIKKKTRMSRKVMNSKRRGASDSEIAEMKKEYNRARNQVRKKSRMMRKEYEENLSKVAQKEKNLKPVYAYMKSKSKTKCGIGDIRINPGNPKSMKTSSLTKKVKIFSEYFASVWTVEPEGDVPTLPVKQIKYEMTDLEITPAMVEKKLRGLNVNKSIGPDEVHPKLLKELATEISEPLSLLYNKSIKESKLSRTCKTALISVLFKKGDKSLASNYRPVSLTSIICKVLESIIKDHFVEYMVLNNLFSDQQYGFINGRSSTLQLLKVMDEWTAALDEGNSINCIYMDFMKAFDTVPHRRMLSKLRSFGFTETMVKWVESFITGRTQQVRIDGEISEEKIVISGVPQGSVLGPFLFLIYVNDMPEAVRSRLFLFADDNKVYRIIEKASLDRSILQEDLDKLYEWSKVWLMRIHPEKLFGMEIGADREVPEYEYTVGPMMVRTSKQERDIGIEIDDKLTFANHIDTQVKKANSKAGWLRRTFQFLTPKVFRPLYMQIVRNNLEYAVPVWSPYQKTLIDKIESVQERATKMLPGMKNKTYEERLKILKLPTLKYRRIRGDMINAYKILNGFHRRQICPNMKMTIDITGRPGRNSLALYQDRSNTNIRKHSFVQRIVAIWNTLPDHVVKAPSVNCFKARLDKLWQNESIKYDHREALSAVRVTRR
jgi:hypothetical protein